jgi:hypothetical protein
VKEKTAVYRQGGVRREAICLFPLPLLLGMASPTWPPPLELILKLPTVFRHSLEKSKHIRGNLLQDFPTMPLIRLLRSCSFERKISVERLYMMQGYVKVAKGTAWEPSPLLNNGIKSVEVCLKTSSPCHD